MRFKTVMTSEKITHGASINWISCKNCASSKWSEWLQMALLPQWEKTLSIARSSRDVWPSSWARRKTQGALTSNYSTRMETKANLKAREKTQGFSHRDAERRITRKRELLSIQLLHEYYLSIYFTSCYDFIGSRWEYRKSKPIFEEKIGIFDVSFSV